MTLTAALLAGVVISPLVGYIVYFTVGSLQGMATSGWVSLVLCVGVPLAERLLLALQAGQDAGGGTSAEGSRLR